MILTLSTVCLILLLTILLLLHDIFRITRDLDYINQHDANGQVTTGSGLSVTKKLAKACNYNLKQLHQLQETQETQNKQFDQMLTNLTHDIKTPLTVSMGYVQLLTQQSKGKQNSDLLRIQNNLESVNYYLHYLMDFNLIQEKSQSLNVNQFNLSETLQKELFNYYDQLNEKNISVNLEIESDIIIQSDEMMFKRIFENLIGNIIKYAINDTTIRLQKSNSIIQIDFENSTNEIIDNSSILLNRFYTADNSRNNHSIGLGLSIVQSLVTTLGGRVQLTSKGNHFEVNLLFKHLYDQKNLALVDDD